MAQQLQAAAARIQQLEGTVKNLEVRLREMETQIKEREAYIRELERQVKSGRAVPPASVAPPALDTSLPVSEQELEQTLKRLVAKIAMILQAEKCVILLHDPRTRELSAHRPAFGISDEQIHLLRVADNQGISGAVFQSGRPLIVEDLRQDHRTEPWMLEPIGARNSASVPLFVEKRDEENRLIDRVCIGVLHVFNKRYSAHFAQEDIHLLGVLARSASAVIASAKLFFEAAAERDQMQATLESLAAGLVMVGSNAKIMLMNASAKAMLQVAGRGEMGKPFEEVIQHDRVKELLRLAVLHGQEVAGEEITLVHRDADSGEDRESTYQVQTVLVRNTETKELIGAALVLNDITEIRNVERMKAAFISNISHELNTPLTTIKGFVSTLLQDRNEFYSAQERREFYQIIDSECNRLSRLIGNLLSLSRIESGSGIELDLKPVNVASLVARVVEAHRPHLTERHEIVTEIFPGLPPLLADEDKVDQILANITSNAIKFSPNGGKITIQVTPDDGFIRFDVTDEGIGIPKEHLPYIFDRFYRVDQRDSRETGGTGIGLYLVKHLVEAHGGSISVESETGKGTRFTVRLPLKPPHAGEAPN